MRSTDYKRHNKNSLRIADAMSVVAAACSLLIGPLIITITDLCPCRSIVGGSRNCRGFNTVSLLLLLLVIIIGVIDDDYLAVTRRPEDVVVEIAKKLSDEFLIARSINNGRGRVNHWGHPGGTALLKHW
jgi:hypothetical protein